MRRHLFTALVIPLVAVAVAVTAFQTPPSFSRHHLRLKSPSSNGIKNLGVVAMSTTDHQDRHHDNSEQHFFVKSRRDVISVGIQGSVLVAALLASGATPALAADIAKQMKVLENEFRDSINSSGAPEKHLPKVSLSSVKGNNGNDLTMVQVVVPHVMDPDKPHWIQAIWLKEESSGDVAVAKVLPATEPSPPSLTCGVPKGARLTPYLYCNLHGLWKGDTFTA